MSNNKISIGRSNIGKNNGKNHVTDEFVNEPKENTKCTYMIKGTRRCPRVANKESSYCVVHHAVI